MHHHLLKMHDLHQLQDSFSESSLHYLLRHIQLLLLLQRILLIVLPFREHRCQMHLQQVLRLLNPVFLLHLNGFLQNHPEPVSYKLKCSLSYSFLFLSSNCIVSDYDSLDFVTSFEDLEDLSIS